MCALFTLKPLYYALTPFGASISLAPIQNKGDKWTRWLANERKWKTKKDWMPWSLDQQTAGYATTYEGPGANNFTFVTVKGAGHMGKHHCLLIYPFAPLT